MESIDNLNKMLTTAKNLVTDQNELVDKKIQGMTDEKEKTFVKDLLIRARKGELTTDQLIKEVNGYNNRD